MAIKPGVPFVTLVDGEGLELGVSGPGTDRSGTIATGGSPQVLAAANPNRHSLTGQNTHASAVLRIAEKTGRTAGAAVGYSIGPGVAFKISTNEEVTVWSSTTGASWEATET